MGKSLPTTTTEAIPHPRSYPLVGNVLDINPEDPMTSIVNLMKRYGPIMAMKFPKQPKPVIMVGSQELVHELCDQERFIKNVSGALQEVRSVAKDGLFTAYHTEESWAIAHRILIPSFGPLSIRGMFDGMFDIASQLIMKWSRFGEDRIDVCTDFTKLTLDTIAFSTFSYRFNSFYREQNHPFVDAMAGSLRASGDRLRRIPGTGWMYTKANKKYKEDIQLLHDLADNLVKERKDSGERSDDLLDRLLYGRDHVTGQGLSTENIRYQLVTFLIAGHETTSGLLSFLFHYLLQTPSSLQKIREEVDRVCGDQPVKFEQLSKLEYVDAALKETLRLKSTAPAFGITPKNGDELLGGKYKIAKGQNCMVVLDALHLDPKVWGDDAEVFKPERLLNDGFKNLPPDSWKPFGNGVRGCIGRPFAWQESLLIVAMIFQTFDFRPHNPKYQLKIKQTLTVKPADFYMHVTPRKGRDVKTILGSGAEKAEQQAAKMGSSTLNGNGEEGEKIGLSIYYGSNSGTCKALAMKMADTAEQRGVNTEIHDLNAVAAGNLPTDRPVAIVTTSYEGQPTDDAATFFEWLKKAPSDGLAGVNYGVFGCGHPDWVATYHIIPKTIDKLMHHAGGTRLVERGLGNAAAAELFEEFDDWEIEFLAAIVDKDKDGQATANGSTSLDVKPTLSVKIDTTRREKVLQLDEMVSATINSNDIISGKPDGEAGKGYNTKRHIEISLPKGLTYQTGDYLAILPTNPDQTVQRALRRFNLHPDDLLTITGRGRNLPLDTPVSAYELMSGFVELGQPATKRQIEGLLPHMPDGEEKVKLVRYTQAEVYDKELAAKRVSLLDLLEDYPGIKLDLGDFLLSLPALRIRQYSISSSPLHDASRCTITISIIAQPHLSGHGDFLGTATSYLSSLTPGSPLRATVRSTTTFRPPLDPSKPIILAAAGSGIAPFRAFLQERSIQKSSGRDVGPALLYYGCHSEVDALYDEELKRWEAEGVVSFRHAFSRDSEKSNGCKYVQNRMMVEKAEFVDSFFNAGAKVYICGSPQLSDGVKKAIISIWSEHVGKTEEEGWEWMRGDGKERFATDVFL